MSPGKDRWSSRSGCPPGRRHRRGTAARGRRHCPRTGSLRGLRRPDPWSRRPTTSCQSGSRHPGRRPRCGRLRNGYPGRGRLCCLTRSAARDRCLRSAARGGLLRLSPVHRHCRSRPGGRSGRSREAARHRGARSRAVPRCGAARCPPRRRGGLAIRRGPAARAATIALPVTARTSLSLTRARGTAALAGAAGPAAAACGRPPGSSAAAAAIAGAPVIRPGGIATAAVAAALIGPTPASSARLGLAVIAWAVVRTPSGILGPTRIPHHRESSQLKSSNRDVVPGHAKTR
jgi:hypothetical protein